MLKAHGKGDFDVLVRYNGWWKRLLLFVIGDFCAPDGACVQRAPDLDFKAGKPFNSLELNRWYHIELEVKGDKFTLGIDEKEVLFYRDNTIKSGAVGLGLANYTARFDNIEITGPDVPDVTPPTWKPRPVDPNEKLPTMWGKIKRNR